MHEVEHDVEHGAGHGGETGREVVAVGVREGLLALLDRGPQHGYGLKLAFEDATGGTWDLNVGQVYGALQKLEADGHVALDGEADGRKRYQLTDAGRVELTRWLVDEPVARTTATRDELAMKVLLAGCTDTVAVHDVIAAQRDATMRELQHHTHAKADAGEHAAPTLLIHLDRLILHGRAELDWLELTEQRLLDHERHERHGGRGRHAAGEGTGT